MLGKATVILRGYTYEQVRLIAEELVGSKVKNMEITLNTEDAITTIRKISAEFGDRLNIGAGTVLTYEELVAAIDAGAKFVLSPNMMSPEMLAYCKEKGVISVPGGYTPSEISTLFAQGADIVKVFPANELSHSYAKKVCEPLGDLPLMAVGGVNTENVKEIFKGGYQFVGTAGGIFKKQDLLDLNREAIRVSIQAFEAQLDD